MWLCVASADNQIGKEGAEALADALKTNSSLQTLNLSSEYYGRRGAAANQIGNEGAEALVDALKTNSSIQTLNLSCEYGGRGGEGRREKRGCEGEFRDSTRTHGLTCGYVWHLQTTRLDWKALRPWRTRSRPTRRSRR